MIGSLELPRARELAGLEVHALEEFGHDELLRSGRTRREIRDELNGRVCEALGVRAATVPGGFPIEVADALRSRGVELAPDEELFERRRRVKNEHELSGIRRAQRAAEAGMEAARELLRGGPVAVERVKSAIGHHAGDGDIAAGEPIVIDLWPRDRASGCHADMTRTYVIGEPDDELREWHRLCQEALDRALGEVRAGITGRSGFDGTCEIFEREGYTTQRTKEQGKPLEEGFFHSLGHGVGLEVHEAPSLGLLGEELVAGDVVSVEPGLYRPGYGGCRLEDLVLVTEDGCENLTEFPYELVQ